MLCDLMDELAPNSPLKTAKQWIIFVKDRSGHDRCYAIDATKINMELGSIPQETIEKKF